VDIVKQNESVPVSLSFGLTLQQIIDVVSLWINNASEVPIVRLLKAGP
jgi:hypothetical protein